MSFSIFAVNKCKSIPWKLTNLLNIFKNYNENYTAFFKEFDINKLAC